MRIAAGGNVGIGTTAPLSKLEVIGPSGVTSFTGTTRLGVMARGATGTADYSGIDFTSDATGGNPSARIAAISSGGGSTLMLGTSNNYGSGITNSAMAIDEIGRVGIGNFNPGFRLDVDNTLDATTLNLHSDQTGFLSSGQPVIQVAIDNGTPNSTAGFTLKATYNAADIIQVRNDGNTGIGTAVTAEKLTVAGNVVPSADNTYTSGTTALKWSAVWASNGTIQTSDERLKENIEARTYGLNEVMDLRPVSYTWKDRPEQGRKVGLIAQEVQPLVPEVVHVGDDERQTLGLNYADLVPVLTKAIQEQQEIIEQQQAQIEKQQAADTAMRARIDDLSQKLDVIATSIASKTESLGSIQGSLKVAQLTNGGRIDGRGTEVETDGN